MCKSLGILPGDLVVTSPELFLFFIRQPLDPAHQDLRLLHKNRKRAAGKGICINPHLLCRRDDNPQFNSPNICAGSGLSASLTLSNINLTLPNAQFCNHAPSQGETFQSHQRYGSSGCLCTRMDGSRYTRLSERHHL